MVTEAFEVRAPLAAASSGFASAASDIQKISQ
jgi:hypothetical protein